MTPPRATASTGSDGETGRYDGQFRPEFSRLHEDDDLLWISPLAVRYVVGIVGYRSAGKSTVLSYLADKRNFDVYTLSTLVREAAEDAGLRTTDRATLQWLGDELRAQHRIPAANPGHYGDGAFFARLLLRRLHNRYHTFHFRADSAPRIAISGFKHPDELRALSHMRNFTVFCIDARDQEPVALMSPRDDTGLQTRAYRAYFNGTLARELGASTELRALAEELAPPGLGTEPPAEIIAKAEAAFSEYLDRPDREAADRPDWMRPFAQDVDGVIACAREWLEDETHSGVLLQNGFGTKLTTLQRRIDSEILMLDHEYRV